MGGYRSEDEALIGLARQLTDAYGEARRREDQDFACDAIDEFLSEHRASAPSEALLAILDLPLTAETYPLVDEAQTLLAERGPGVVGLLLEALLGEVYDPDGPAPERAAETLGLMDRRDAIQGLTEVLCGRADDDVKGAAVDGLVALGPFAEPALARTLDDPRGGEWAQAALDQIRYDAAPPEALEDYAAGEGDVPDDAGAFLFEEHEPAEADTRGRHRSDESGQPEQAADHESPGEQHAGGEEADQTAVADEGAPDQDAAAPAGIDDMAAGSTGPMTAAEPDQEAVNDAYDEFLRRFGEQADGEKSSS
jgi:hypothetical protein